MFSKKKPAPPERSRSPSPPPPPAAPTRLVRYDRNEKREYVLNIVELRAPKDGQMEVRLADTPDWLTLHKAEIDVRAVLNEFTYNAVYSNSVYHSQGSAQYRQVLKCQMVLRGFSGRSPLIAFPPFERRSVTADEPGSAPEDEDLDFVDDDDDEDQDEITDDDESGEYYTTWGVYTAAISDVSVHGGGEADEAADARPPVALWASEREADDAQGAMLKERKALAEGEKHTVAWPKCMLNTSGRLMTPRWDEPDIRSYLTLPPVVFEGLRRDVIEMGRSIRVEALLTIEAYVLNWRQNYGYSEYDDHRFNFDLALIPHGSVLSADLQQLDVKWREGGSMRRAETREERMEEAAPPLDADPTKPFNIDD